MSRTAAILTLIAVVSLLSASDVRGGAALFPAGKTTGPGLIATIVTDVTGTGTDPLLKPGKGLTTIRVQKAATSAAVVFQSSYVNSFVDECIASGFPDKQSSTANRFTGLIDGFIDTPSVLTALLQNFGDPHKAAITNQDYVECTSVAGRQILSFTAVIQFKP